MFYLGLLGLGLFGDILGKRLKSSSSGDRKWYWSIFETGNGSLGHAWLKLVNSTQTLNFPFFFFTIMVLAN